MNKLNFLTKQSGDPLEAQEWNSVVNKIDELVDASNNGTSTTIDTSGIISVSAKGNVTLGSSKNVNIEPAWNNNTENYTGNYGDIAFKPGDDIQYCSHHREPKKRDKVVIKGIDGSDNPVKMQLMAGEIELAVGSKSNPKSATRKKNKTTGVDTIEPLFKDSDSKVLDIKILTGNILDENTSSERDERGYLKVRAQAIDLRCEKHGGIALQPKGYDGEGNMNKIKFEHGGGDGLEFGTFNAEKASLFTNEYRFNKNGIWKMATRETQDSGKTIYDDNTPVGKESTGAKKYVKLADDFYDIINVEDEQCTTKDIIKTSYALNGYPTVHTKITNSGNLEIATSTQFLLTKTDNAPDVYNTFEILSPYTSFVDGKYYSLTEVLTPINEITNEGSRYVSGERIGEVAMDWVRNQFSSFLNNLETITLTFSDNVYYTFTKFAAPNIKIDSGAELKLGGILDFGSSFNFGETDKGIEVQYKLTKKNNTKDCGILKVIGVNNHPTNNLEIEGVTIAPGQTSVIAQCSLLDIIKLVNYMKNNNQGPWA